MSHYKKIISMESICFNLKRLSFFDFLLCRHRHHHLSPFSPFFLTFPFPNEKKKSVIINVDVLDLHVKKFDHEKRRKKGFD